MQKEQDIKEVLYLEQSYSLKIQQGKLDAGRAGSKNLEGYDRALEKSLAKIQALRWVLDQGALWKND